MIAPNAPSTLFVQLTTECNYRCRYCHMWTLKDEPGGLTTSEKVALVEAFAEMNPAGEVVLTGGETMMRDGEFYSLVKRCRELGLRSATNTNGSYISPAKYDFLLENGPDFLVFSLDSHVGSVHDYNRGIPGSFASTCTTIVELLNARAKLPNKSPVELITNSVLLEDNITSIFDYVEFATALGIDGVIFQVLSPTFHRKGSQDKFYERHFFRHPELAVDILQRLRRRLEEFPVVRTKDDDLHWMQQYILNPDAMLEPVCDSHERNMMVDHLGNVQLCFNMLEIFDGKHVGSVRNSTLQELWYGTTAENARAVMQRCRKTCGMLNCHRKQA